MGRTDDSPGFSSFLTLPFPFLARAACLDFIFGNLAALHTSARSREVGPLSDASSGARDLLQFNTLTPTYRMQNRLTLHSQADVGSARLRRTRLPPRSPGTRSPPRPGASWPPHIPRGAPLYFSASPFGAHTVYPCSQQPLLYPPRTGPSIRTFESGIGQMKVQRSWWAAAAVIVLAGVVHASRGSPRAWSLQ
jgi:hypothetical protein